MALLKQTVASQEEKIENLEEEAKELNKKLEEALRVGVQEQKKKKRYYWRDIAHIHSSKETENNVYAQSYIDELNTQIQYLENEKMMLEQKLKDFLANEEIFFHNGRYNDKICTVYQDLMRMGLSSWNVEKVLEIVLRDLHRLEVAQLPGKTFSNLMMLEAPYVAQIHVADELSITILNDPDNTLHSDGTSKKGHSYLTYDYNKGDGTTLVAGLRCVGGGM